MEKENINIKKIVLYIVLLIFINQLYSSNWYSRTRIFKVMDLPNDEYTLMEKDGLPPGAISHQYIDLGYKVEQIILPLFDVPLWNPDGEYGGYIKTKEGSFFYAFKDRKPFIDYLRENNLAFPATRPKLPFWDVYGGKLLALFLFGMIIRMIIGVIREFQLDNIKD